MIAATIGDAIVPTIGPMTATSPTRWSSPKTSAQAIQAMRPSDRPLTNRIATSIANTGETADSRLATTPNAIAATIIRRRGRNRRGAIDVANTNPAS